MGHRERYFYAISRTQWGWFGVLGGEQGLVRTYLPIAHKEAVQRRILSDAPDAKSSKTVFSVLKNRIHAYYEGTPDDFLDVGICLDGLSEFRRNALTTLRKITYGKTVSYAQLANLANSPKATRAIGTVMAQNPLPLVIPCHRVIKSDGTVGQFSAPGGTDTKKQM